MYEYSCTYKVAHAKLNTVSHVLFFSLTVVLYSHAPALLYSCSHVYSSSAITFSSQPLASGPQQGVSSCIISFDCIWEHKFKQEYADIYTHKYKYERNHLVLPASYHQARQPCTGRQLCLLSLSPGENIPSRLELTPYALKMSTAWMEWNGWYPFDCYDY